MSVDLDRLRDEYPFESRWVTVGGQRMHYLDEGAGDPVVFVHGNPTWSFYYRRLVRALRESHRCIVPDHVGCGLSDKPDAARYDYTLERRVSDLQALLEHLDLRRRVSFVVHDWGGMIGLTAALRRIETVHKLIILNTSGFLKPPKKRMPWMLSLIRNGGPAAAWLVQGLNAFAAGAAWTATVRRMPRQIRSAYCGPYDSWSHRIAILRFVQDIPLEADDRSFALAQWTDQNLSQLARFPMLIGWGRRDFVFDDHFLREWRARMPDACVHIFEYAGHYVLEDAADELVPLIVQFLMSNAAWTPAPPRPSQMSGALQGSPA